MFGLTNRLFRGATNRSFEKLQREFGTGPATSTLALALATACYPSATYGDKGIADVNTRRIKALLLKPCDARTACRLTEDWLDRNLISTHEVFQRIWSVSPESFLVSVDGPQPVSAPRTPSLTKPARLPAASALAARPTGDPSIDDAFDAVSMEYARFKSDDPVGQQQLLEMQGTIRQRYESRPRTLTDAAAVCIDRFVAAELDFTTPNARGMGRMSEHTPRFAAKHREVFSSVSYQLLSQLRTAIKRHIVCAYLWFDFMSELPEGNEASVDNSMLFDRWIPLIYMPPRELTPEHGDLADIQRVWLTATARSIHEICSHMGIVWDSRDDRLDSDSFIVTRYFDAGVTLRYAEALLTTTAKQRG